MAYDKRKMQDISIDEKNVWLEYMEYVKNKDFANANILLDTNPTLKYKVMSSYNWNRLQNLVNDGSVWSTSHGNTIDTDATQDSLVGRFASDYNELLNVGNNVRFVGYWSAGVEYKEGNLIKLDEHLSYFCIATHSSDASNKPPNKNFWILAANMEEDTVGLPVQKDSPFSNIVYFKIIN